MSFTFSVSKKPFSQKKKEWQCGSIAAKHCPKREIEVVSWHQILWSTGIWVSMDQDILYTFPLQAEVFQECTDKCVCACMALSVSLCVFMCVCTHPTPISAHIWPAATMEKLFLLVVAEAPTPAAPGPSQQGPLPTGGVWWPWGHSPLCTPQLLTPAPWRGMPPTLVCFS